MVAFRKLFVCIAVLALALGATTAFAANGNVNTGPALNAAAGNQIDVPTISVYYTITSTHQLVALVTINGEMAAVIDFSRSADRARDVGTAIVGTVNPDGNAANVDGRATARNGVIAMAGGNSNCVANSCNHVARSALNNSANSAIAELGGPSARVNTLPAPSARDVGAVMNGA